MKWRNAFYWWRDLASSSAWRLQKLIFVYERRVTFSLSSSVLCSSLCLSLVVVVVVFYLLFSWLCVCFVNIIIFRLCFQYNRHCRVSHLFLSDLSKSNACCAHGEYLQGENMNLFSFGAFFFLLFFRFKIFFLAFAPYSVSKRLCKNWRKKRMHKIIRIALVLYLRLRFFINAAPHLTTVLSMHFSAVWCWSIVGRTVQQINESLNEKWMYKSKM